VSVQEFFQDRSEARLCFLELVDPGTAFHGRKSEGLIEETRHCGPRCR
jgi:hypothetical protein